MSLEWISHITRMIESSHTRQRVSLHTMSHMTHAQYICIWVCVLCTFRIIYVITCVCLVNMHSRSVCCAWNGKYKVDHVLASVRFSAALVLVRIRVAHMKLWRRTRHGTHLVPCHMWVMSHSWVMSRLSQITLMNHVTTESCHTYTWVLSHSLHEHTHLDLWHDSTSHVWHDSFTLVPWRMDMTHSLVWHEPLTWNVCADLSAKVPRCR